MIKVDIMQSNAFQKSKLLQHNTSTEGEVYQGVVNQKYLYYLHIHLFDSVFLVK